MAVNAYRTVLGPTIHFGDLPTNQVCVIHEILEEKRKHEPPHAQASGPESFAVAARKWITAEYPHDADFLRAFRGPIGEVYRDCYYRLLADTVSGEDPPRIL